MSTSLTEFGLIEKYFKPLGENGSFLLNQDNLGIGDDCAIITPPIQQQLCITTDTLVAGRHFPLDTSPQNIGYKSLAVNLSDLAAMGADPFGVTLALSSPNVDETWLQQFVHGFSELCEQFQISLIGGDTTSSPTLSITITALGWVPLGQAIRRSGAQPGDIIAVSGSIGSAAYALFYPQSALQHTLDRPFPQITLGKWLREHQLAHSMLDVSDGLAQDLTHILKASQVNAQIELSNIPIAQELNKIQDAQKYHLVLNGGDDYQLCFTCASSAWDFIKQNAPIPVHQIGTITQSSAQPSLTTLLSGQPYHMSLQGYQHF